MRELQNVIERAVWFADGDTIHVEHLAESLRAAAESVLPPRERRTQVADELYTALVSAGYSFWNHISPLFLSRDIPRHDMRGLVRRGLTTTRGNYAHCCGCSECRRAITSGFSTVWPFTVAAPTSASSATA